MPDNGEIAALVTFVSGVGRVMVQQTELSLPSASSEARSTADQTSVLLYPNSYTAHPPAEFGFCSA